MPDNAGGRLEIDLAALAQNYRLLTKKSPNSETAAAVKANAYGLGIEQVAPVLVNSGCKTFFVALPEEGVKLRKLAPDASIYVLSGIWPESLELLFANRLTPVLNSLRDVKLWESTTTATSTPFALHVDTGMNRLGLEVDQVGQVSHLKPQLIMTHFACADDPAHPLNQKQFDAFSEIRKMFPQARASLANSAAILSRGDCQFDLVRPGIALYGGAAVNGQKNPMQPVVRLQGRIVQIRHIKSGAPIGYGASHVFKRDSKVAIVAVGYADGYHRAASGSGVPLSENNGGGYGFFNGCKVPIVGRISMDLTAFDITDVLDGSVNQGEWIELIGKNIPVEEVAASAGTIDYEILTSLGRRFARSYING